MIAEATHMTPEEIAASNPDVLWSFITQDVSGRVLVVDEHGTILFANKETCAKYAHIGRPVVGASLFEDIGKGRLGAEWRRLCSATLDSGVPSAVETMIAGVRVRAMLRPMTSGDTRCLLIVSRDMADFMPEHWDLPEGVRELRGSVEDWGKLDCLTSREREILGLIGLGLSAAGIAERLSRSPKTIEWHRHQIGQKLHVKSRVELAAIAIRAGLTPIVDVDHTLGDNATDATNTELKPNARPQADSGPTDD